MVSPGLIVSSTRLIYGFIKGKTTSGIKATVCRYSSRTSFNLQKYKTQLTPSTISLNTLKKLAINTSDAVVEAKSFTTLVAHGAGSYLRFL